MKFLEQIKNLYKNTGAIHTDPENDVWLYAVQAKSSHTCSACGNIDIMPYVCKRCHKVVCNSHILPEKHDCTNFTAHKSYRSGRWFKKELR